LKKKKIGQGFGSMNQFLIGWWDVGVALKSVGRWTAFRFKWTKWLEKYFIHH